jgi:putative ABC transport system substrate-binding protein
VFGLKRREVITLLGGAVAWPLAARAQQQMPVIGLLGSASPGPWAQLVAAFRAGLKEAGFTEGQNVAIVFRWADGQYDRLPALAADLVRSRVDVLVATGGQPTVMAAKTATSEIPIVFTLGSDPVAMVSSRTSTGRAATSPEQFCSRRRSTLSVSASCTTWLRALPPRPYSSIRPARSKEIEAAARRVGKRVHFLHASTEEEIEAAFAMLGRLDVGALFVGADPFFHSMRDTIVSLAARHAIPAIYEQRSFAVAGGLMSYGTDFLDTYRQAGIYTGRILKGEKPGDLPIVQATKFELVINLKTAKALGIDVPPGVSAQADEIIE